MRQFRTCDTLIKDTAKEKIEKTTNNSLLGSLHHIYIRLLRNGWQSCLLCH